MQERIRLFLMAVESLLPLMDMDQQSLMLMEEELALAPSMPTRFPKEVA